jgi:hypothetical protein
VFLDAEEAYLRYLPPDYCGTISLEPLVSDRPGPPVYLTGRLSESQRSAYAEQLNAIRSDLEKLTPAVPRQDNVSMILRCIDGCLKDLS